VTPAAGLGLVAVGFVASALNVVAGGGSFLTLPALIFLGLPAGEANATNRVGVVAQNVGAAWGFHRHRVLDWRWALAVTVPGLLGTALGAALALRVADKDLQRFLALTMVAMTLWTLFAPRTRPPAPASAPSRTWLVHGFSLLVGVYAGFVQAGAGLLFLALTTLAGLDLVRGNAAKALSMFFQTLLSLAIFAASGTVRWPEGVALALGSLAGSLLGVHLTVLKGQRWLERVVAVTVITLAVRLWFW
jgi:uncharacterized membrane protein YfcA